MPLEKKLGKKLVEPLTNVVNSTSAMSLLYECIQTCTLGLPDHPAVIRLCISKLRSFVEDPDQNRFLFFSFLFFSFLPSHFPHSLHFLSNLGGIRNSEISGTAGSEQHH